MFQNSPQAVDCGLTSVRIPVSPYTGTRLDTSITQSITQPIYLRLAVSASFPNRTLPAGPLSTRVPGAAGPQPDPDRTKTPHPCGAL